jgi:hypothetical protein
VDLRKALDLALCIAGGGQELAKAKMVRCRVRYFSDGVVIGSKGFMNAAFAAARDRFTARRKDGARWMRGNAKVAAGTLWSVRVGIRGFVCCIKLIRIGRAPPMVVFRVLRKTRARDTEWFRAAL